MKQNEKILVYAVTGFLVVILMVAVVFGKETPRGVEHAAGGTDGALSLEDVLDQRAAEAGTLADGEGAADGAGGAGDGTGGEDAAGTAGRALAANVQLGPPTVESLVTRHLGLSRRDRDYRIVRAQRGDSLSSLVQKWCGSTEGWLEAASALNEELTILRVGEDVVLPWVDDAVVLRAFEARATGPATGPVRGMPAEVAFDSLAAAVPPAPAGRPEAPAAPAPSRRYEVAPGDSLWKIAERAVSRSKVPGYLEKVRALNPGLDADRLRVGQTLLLPADG